MQGKGEKGSRDSPQWDRNGITSSQPRRSSGCCPFSPTTVLGSSKAECLEGSSGFIHSASSPNACQGLCCTRRSQRWTKHAQLLPSKWDLQGVVEMYLEWQAVGSITQVLCRCYETVAQEWLMWMDLKRWVPWPWVSKGKCPRRGNIRVGLLHGHTPMWPWANCQHLWSLLPHAWMGKRAEYALQDVATDLHMTSHDMLTLGNCLPRAGG